VTQGYVVISSVRVGAAVVCTVAARTRHVTLQVSFWCWKKKVVVISDVSTIKFLKNECCYNYFWIWEYCLQFLVSVLY